VDVRVPAGCTPPFIWFVLNPSAVLYMRTAN
jgi:hypothetical protein